jgi:hypothetical protein
MVPCPFKFTVNSLGEVIYKQVAIYLSREKIEINGKEKDIKYYYNCCYAEACDEEKCTWRRSQLAYERVREKLQQLTE